MVSPRLFVSRRSPKRRFRNQLQIENLFVRNNFTVVYLEDFCCIDQLSLFRQAAHVSALHGAGLANLVAAKKGTRVLEIFGLEGSHAYQKICPPLGLQYTHLCADDQLSIGSLGKASITSIRHAIAEFV